MELRGRVALVTGAGRGIGRAIALCLAGAGADVAVGYAQDQAAAEGVVGEIRRIGRRAVAVAGDLGDPAQVAGIVDHAERELGAIDILVSNAGIGARQPLAEITVEDWDRVLNVNLRAAFLLAQRVAPGMQRRRWGRVVLVSSVAAFNGGLLGVHYATSKAGQLGLVHALAGPLAPDGVTVNAVAPALIEGTGLMPKEAEALRQIAQRVPVQRLGRPEEVAQAVLLLVTNPYMTGQTVSVDGGIYPR